jgi:hypothetical protein
MIRIIGTSVSVLLDPDRYEVDSDPAKAQNESYTGIIYKTVRRTRKRFTIGAVIDETEKTELETLEAEGSVSFIDEENTTYTAVIDSMRSQRIAGTNAYTLNLVLRGWES